MIQLSRNYSLPEREDQIIPIKVIAIGSAGSNALDRVVLDGMDKSDLIAANTDVQSLASSVAAVKVQLGRSLTRGLGPVAILSSVSMPHKNQPMKSARRWQKRA